MTETGAGGTPERGRPRRIPVWVTYTVLRLLVFAVPLVVIYLVGGNIVIAAAAAAVIGVCLSVILLHRQRTAVATELQAWRAARRANRREPTDEDVEDDVAGGQNAKAAASPRP